MMTLHELMKHFRFLSDIESYSPEERQIIEKLLSQEHALKEQNEERAPPPYVRNQAGEAPV